MVYHRDYAAGWVIRLGDGTEHSRERMKAGLEAVWPLFDELFRPDPVLEELPRARAEPGALRSAVEAVVDEVLAAATLVRPAVPTPPTSGGPPGRDGVHTEQLGQLLAELQSVARAHPQGTW
jgi:ring-1,2-phenylacetyl-CoA epoxidase subunit PaaC